MAASERRIRPAARATARAAVAMLLAALLALLAGVAPAQAAPAPPRLDASAWLLLDARDGTKLAAHRAKSRQAIASTTKLMTVWLALRDLDFDERLTVPKYSAAPAESVAGLRAGERLTVRDLVVAMLLPSANDAAVTVAEGVSGSEAAFVGEMNAAAAQLGLDDTNYSNPIGLDEPGNYSTAADLADLTLELLEDRRIRHIVRKPAATLRSGSQVRRVVNTNTLLRSDPSVDGVKTGHTLDAGYVLIASARRDGVPLLSVLLGASSEPARDAESQELLDHGFSLYRKRTAVAARERVGAVPVRWEDEPLPLLAARPVTVPARADQQIETEPELPGEIEGPIDAGQRLGRVSVTLDGRFVGRVPLRAAHAVAAPTFVDRIGGPFVALLIVVVAGVILTGVALALRRRGGRGANRGATRRRR